MSESAVDIANEVLALLKAEQEKNAALREKLKASYLRQGALLEGMQDMIHAIENEPMYPGDMPEEMFAMIVAMAHSENGRHKVSKAIRLTVKQYRTDILKSFDKVAEKLYSKEELKS
jgi:hypothetical protein